MKTNELRDPMTATQTATDTETVRLNLGSGESPMAGYVNIDLAHGGAYPLSGYEDNSVDEVRASHLLEHFSHREVQAVIHEWVRVLKPGGLLKIAVPDFDKIVNAYMNGAGDRIPIESYLMGGQVDAGDHHGSIWQRQKLEAMMNVAGIRGVHEFADNPDDCSSLPVSLNLCGYKASVDLANLKRDVFAVMTRPRFIEATAADCQERLLLKTGIRMLRSGGVFWDQGISRVIEKALADEPSPKYILTLDYDTIFTPNDVVELYTLMEAMPDANAMVPLQMRRDSIYALLTPPTGQDGLPAGRIDAERLEHETMPIRSGHFGLTLLRASAVRDLQRPWFAAQPDKQGGWNDGRIDADVNFWLNLGRHAGGIYCANRVVVGHAQQVITWPTSELTPVHQYAPDYTTNGKPTEAL